MLAVLTALGFVIAFAAAPPHFAAPLTQVHAAGPIEVLLLFVLLVAVSAKTRFVWILAHLGYHLTGCFLKQIALLSRGLKFLQRFNQLVLEISGDFLLILARGR